MLNLFEFAVLSAEFAGLALVLVVVHHPPNGVRVHLPVLPTPLNQHLPQIPLFPTPSHHPSKHSLVFDGSLGLDFLLGGVVAGVGAVQGRMSGGLRFDVVNDGPLVFLLEQLLLQRFENGQNEFVEEDPAFLEEAGVEVAHDLQGNDGGEQTEDPLGCKQLHYHLVLSLYQLRVGLRNDRRDCSI